MIWTSWAFFAVCLDLKQCMRTQVVAGDWWVAAVYFGSRRRRMWGGQIYGGGGSCQINRTSIQARNGQAGEEVWRIQNWLVSTSSQTPVVKTKWGWGSSSKFDLRFKRRKSSKRRAFATWEVEVVGLRDTCRNNAAQDMRLSFPLTLFQGPQKLFKRILPNVQN